MAEDARVAVRPAGEKAREPAWLKPATDYGPLLLFLGVYLASDLLTATAALIAATLLALALAWLVARRLPFLSLLAAGLLAVFGGLTLLFADETFIKIKPTVVQLVFAAVIWVSQRLERPVLRFLLGTAFRLPDAAWRVLSLRFALFFVAMALLNELVWRTQSTDLWVTFDTVGQMGLSFLFMLAQVPFILRQQKAGEGGAEAAETTGPQEK